MGLLGLQIVNGITIGMIYGLAALGFTMVFKALGYLNFSHSNTITIGAFVIYTVVISLNIPFLVAMPVVILFMLFYGFVLEKVLFKRFRNASALTFMLVSISLSTVVSNVCLLVFGPQPRALTNVFPSIRLNLGGVSVPFNNV